MECEFGEFYHASEGHQDTKDTKSQPLIYYIYFLSALSMYLVSLVSTAKRWYWVGVIKSPARFCRGDSQEKYEYLLK